MTRIFLDGTQELDWYGLDVQGYIAQMRTAGFAIMPESALQSEEDNDILNTFFASVPIRSGQVHFQGKPYTLESLPKTILPLADEVLRGLFFFDADERNKIQYLKLLQPESPLHFSEIPAHIQYILKRTELLRSCFSEIDSVFASDFS